MTRQGTLVPVNDSFYQQLFIDHVPAKASAYCFEIFTRYRFDFRLSKGRVTKVGDFTFRQGRVPRLTVNRDLNPYVFLITYLHEVAHLAVHQVFLHRVQPHGQAWKRMFQQLMAPVMHETIFPPSVLPLLEAHMRDPAASTFSDSALTRALQAYDQVPDGFVHLYQLPEGALFCFRGRWFKKGKRRRTRVECKLVGSAHFYFMSEDAPVQVGEGVL